MSRYAPSDYRGPRDRSRSPARFADRRPSNAANFDNRPPGPPRAISDLPRGARPQFDGSRPPFTSLRDAPPLGSTDNGRPYREREYDRRDRPLSPRDRSPSRGFKDARDYASRDVDIGRARRESRDGPMSASSHLPDSQVFSNPAPSRGGFIRGRGRGDYALRGGRGGRAILDERDGFRRERSPPPRWGRDLSRDSRDSDRRDDRRFERREDDRRLSDWSDRERESDRGRRDPPVRQESRLPSDAVPTANTSQQSSQAPHVNPARLALIESSGADTSVRRPSVQLDSSALRDGRRDQTETAAYLNGRAETTANRYGSRASSPPTQAPPVPAFTLSFAPPAASQQSAAASQHIKPVSEDQTLVAASDDNVQLAPNVEEEEAKQRPPLDAPIAPKAQLVSPPPADAPKAPRALEVGDPSSLSGRLPATVRTFEHMGGGASAPSAPVMPRAEAKAFNALSPNINQPVSPNFSQQSKAIDVNPPTGPRASRVSPALASVSPRPPFVSPRSDFAAAATSIARVPTPPPSAPSGPRNSSFSVSPKVATSSVPTAPKADRAPPIAPRAVDRGPQPTMRAPERSNPAATWAPPSAPRSQPQWNQWRRPGPPVYGDKIVPAKRDATGEEKGKPREPAGSVLFSNTLHKPGNHAYAAPKPAIPRDDMRKEDAMDADRQPPKRQSNMMAGHSAARSFFGKPSKGEEEEGSTSENAQEPPSSSEDDESDVENSIALFHAKFERQKRQLEAQMVDLSSRYYRATTPLENLARLARISTQDLEKYNQQRDHAMEIERSPVARRNHMIPPTRQSSDSAEAPDVVTPKDEVEHRVAIRSSDDSSDAVRRVRRPTPELVNLPYLFKGSHSPLEDDEGVADGMKSREDTTAEVVGIMEVEMHAEDDLAANIEDRFAHEYRRWREECEDLDRLREEQEKLERQHSLEPKPELDPLSVPPGNTAFEGRRLYKFSSEYEIELVLKQSEETARIEQERQDREARKNQADMEKEAQIPDQFTEKEMVQGLFIDNNRFRDPEALTLVFCYEPPTEDFTENEQHIFIAAFKETPKKWGEIASLLPGRTYQDCIRHYYANKWDGRFRDNRTKKLKAGGRRGRGGARGPRGRVGGLMADLARPDDLLGPENVSEKGRPRRAAAPLTFAEKEIESKANLLGPSPAKKAGAGSRHDGAEAGSEKPGKRQKRQGDKAGRKANKASQPLAALAAASHGSPSKQLLHGTHSKEDLADASLLASLHGGPHGALGTDAQVLYRQEGYVHQTMPTAEETERSKGPGLGPPTKQGASSYWSVPEQNDFVKYIGYFGRDFGAIAAHMGTKTQTMIKNHYQRQVDGGNRPELERAAIEADERRARGEEMGPPPTPTPIQKRKYENTTIPTHRTLAPHSSEDSEAESNAPAQRLNTAKHASPPQYQPQPRFTNSLQSTSVPATRFAPSPLSTSATPSTSAAASSQPRPMQQHPLGSRISLLPDNRSESGSGMLNVFSPVRSQLPQQNRAVPDANSPAFLRNLVQEQERALRKQEQLARPERADQYHLHPSMPRAQPQASSANFALHNPLERKTASDERPPSPARSLFSPSGMSRPLFNPSAFGPFASTPLSSMVGRSSFNPSPPKREDPRIGSYSATPQAPPATAAAPPPEPKRSNVMSLLNSEPEAPKPPKRDSLTSTIPKASSPLQQGFSAAVSLPENVGPRRESSFGQTSLPKSHFHRGSFSHAPPMTSASVLNTELPTANSALAASRKQDWAAHVLNQPSQPSPPTPSLEREGRSMYSHRSIVESMGQPRLDLSPHSRTPSLSGPSAQNQHDPLRPALSSQQPTASQQTMQTRPYPGQQQSPVSSQRTLQAQGQSHHSHSTSLAGPFPSFHQRAPSRNDYTRQGQSLAVQRERDEQDSRWRQRETMDGERRREEQYRQQQEQERERRRTTPLQALRPPPPFGTNPFGQGRIADLREQSKIDSEMAMEQERQRLQQDADRRRQQEMRERDREEDARRRQHEESLFRRTPLGGSFGLPPSGPRR